MPGRKPKPTSLKVLNGNAGKRPLNKNEPKTTPGISRCPSWLSPKAKTAWKEIGGHLKNMNVLNVEDSKALELLCDAYSEWRDARAVIQREGSTYETDTENGVRHWNRPEVSVANDAWRRVKSMLSEFGLTPSSRSKIQVNGSEADDPFKKPSKKRATK
jgi:P27 family predicted phage terminase small subunit